MYLGSGGQAKQLSLGSWYIEQQIDVMAASYGTLASSSIYMF